MYSKRAALVTLISLRRGIKVCGRNAADIRLSVEIPNFVRSFRTATETPDVYNNFDGDISDNQSAHINYDRNIQFYGRNSGAIDQNQNPSRVYGQIGTDRMGFSNIFRGDSGMNQSGHDSASFDSRLYSRNIVCGEVNRIPNGLHGQNSGGQLGNGSVQQNVSSHGYGYGNGGRLENPRVGSYGGREDMPMNNVGDAGVHPQNVAGSHYSNAGNYQRGLNESQSGVGMDYPVTKLGNGSVQQNVSSHGYGYGNGGRLENPRVGSYGGREDMPVNNVGDAGVHPQNVAGSHYSNAGNYQRGLNESQSGVGMDYPVTKLGNGSVQQNVSSHGYGYGNGGRLENPRVGSYGGREDMPVNNVGDAGVHPQNVAGSHYSNAGNYQRGLNESQSGVGMDYLVTKLGNGSVQQNVSSHDYGYGNGGRLENPRVGSYGGREDMPVNNVGDAGVHPQNVAGSYYSNAGNYQRGLNESQSGVGMDYPVTNDPALNAGSVEVAQESQSAGKLEDLDQFTREGKLKEAVELLGLLEKESVRIELPRYMALVKACGENEAFSEAKSVHEHLVKSMIPLEVRIYNKILEMYSKCGSMKDAFAVFDQMPARNPTSWDIMIFWLAKNGHGEDSLELFAEFKQSGLKPDGQMFLGVFSACGVLCDIIEGMLHFESMKNDHGIVPSMEHYVSIVDMMGNAGCLDEALEFIQKMPVEPSVEIWDTLMKFCRIHGNVVLGDRCAELVELLDPLRLNEQSRAGLIPINASDLEKERERKKSGQGPLDVRHRVHEYRAGDRTSPDNDRLYELLRALKQHMKEAGYVPEMKCVLHDVDQETKEEALMAHSERLAAAHGFLTSPPRASIRIIKNLRVCSDCHNVFKIISKIVGREIVARDSKRFHHFRDGSCSCGDFW